MTKQIEVAISSRCNDAIPFCFGTVNIAQLRKRILNELRSETLIGNQLFHVWASEEALPSGNDETSWEYCRRKIREAQVVVVLYNGNSGGIGPERTIGICHSELEEAIATGAARVRTINLPHPQHTTPPDDTQCTRDCKFQEYVKVVNAFYGHTPKCEDDAVALVKGAVYDAVVDLVRSGMREARKGKYDTGPALGWSRLSFDRRAQEMKSVASAILRDRQSSGWIGSDGLHVADIGNSEVGLIVHAIPETLTISAAKERVGQPFLRDHDYITKLPAHAVGPVHLVLCHKGVTETQARTILGFPDATVVRTPFGIYVADNVQKIQLVFVEQCRDPSTTEDGLGSFFHWLTRSGEAAPLVSRATDRAEIVNLIAKLASEDSK